MALEQLWVVETDVIKENTDSNLIKLINGLMLNLTDRGYNPNTIKITVSDRDEFHYFIWITIYDSEYEGKAFKSIWVNMYNSYSSNEPDDPMLCYNEAKRIKLFLKKSYSSMRVTSDLRGYKKQYGK